MLYDWDVVKQTEGWSYPVTEANAAWRFEQYATQPLSDGGFFVMLEDVALISTIGLHHRVGTTVGLGDMIGRAFWGRGYVSEAASAVCRFGFETLRADVVKADVWRNNAASSRVLQKVGFRFTGDPGPGWSATREGHFPRDAYELRREDLR